MDRTRMVAVLLAMVAMLLVGIMIGITVGAVALRHQVEVGDCWPPTVQNYHDYN